MYVDLLTYFPSICPIIIRQSSTPHIPKQVVRRMTQSQLADCNTRQTDRGFSSPKQTSASSHHLRPRRQLKPPNFPTPDSRFQNYPLTSNHCYSTSTTTTATSFILPTKQSNNNNKENKKA